MNKPQEYKFHFLATLPNIVKLSYRAEEILLHYGIAREIRNDILVIVEEAASNIVNHAYRDSPSDQDATSGFDFYIKLEPQSCIHIIFCDNGQTFNFNDVGAPNMDAVIEGKVVGGFGISLMRGLADKIDYSRSADGINTLHIEKRL